MADDWSMSFTSIIKQKKLVLKTVQFISLESRENEHSHEAFIKSYLIKWSGNRTAEWDEIKLKPSLHRFTWICIFWLGVRTGERKGRNSNETLLTLMTHWNTQSLELPFAYRTL